MELSDVERALRRPGEYRLEDGLWEIAVGLWMALTVAVPQFLGGAAANWSPVLVLLAGLAIGPAVRAGKDRWVHPRTGRVTYPEPGATPPTPVSLGLGPDARPVESGIGRGKLLLLSAAAALLAGGVAVSLAASRRRGFGDAGGHVALGVALGASFLLGAWWWRQRRWIVLGLAFPLLAALVASRALPPERALALHAAGIALAILASGTAAFLGHLVRTARPVPEADGR